MGQIRLINDLTCHLVAYPVDRLYREAKVASFAQGGMEVIGKKGFFVNYIHIVAHGNVQQRHPGREFFVGEQLPSQTQEKRPRFGATKSDKNAVRKASHSLFGRPMEV